MRERGILHGRYTGFILLAWLMLGLSACVTSPPFQEMSDARQAIALAAEAGAAEKSPVLFEQARQLLQSAKERIETGSYSLARNHATRARLKAIEALNEINSNASR